MKKKKDVAVGVASGEFEDMLDELGPDVLKARVAITERGELDRWVGSIIGRTPHVSKDDDFVRASLCRYIDGDPNWGDDPTRVAGLGVKKKDGNQTEQRDDTHTQAETPEGEDAMTTKKNGNGNAPAAAKANGKKAVEKSAPPKKEAAKSDRPLGKTTGMTRAAWFMDFIRGHKDNLPADEKILEKAVAEFGDKVVGPGTSFTPAAMRSWWNTCCRRGTSGLTKKDMIKHAEKK